MADPDAREQGLADLVAGAQRGDRASMEQLLRLAYPRTIAACRRVLGTAEPFDAAQNALIAISQRIGQFDGRSSFHTWCYRIAVNAAIDETRRARRHSDRAVDDGAGGLELAEAPGAPPDRAIADRMALRDALAQLHPDQREAFLLRELEGFSYEQIADTTGVPIGTVRSRLARARISLVELLDPRNFEPPEDVSTVGRHAP